MALIGTLIKQPREILPVDISYAATIGARAPSSITPTVETPPGMTTISIATDLPSKTVQLYIGGGTAGQTFKYTVLTDIVIGGSTSRVEDEFLVVVEEA